MPFSLGGSTEEVVEQCLSFFLWVLNVQYLSLGVGKFFLVVMVWREEMSQVCLVSFSHIRVLQ